MFAIRCYRLAAGAEIDGQKFSHEKWTLVEQPTEAQIVQSQPSEKWKHPLLQIIEVKASDDPALKPFPVEEGKHEEDKHDVDLTTLSLKELAVLAEPLGIEVKPGTKKADVIAAILAEWHEEAAENESAEKEDSAKTKEQKNE